MRLGTGDGRDDQRRDDTNDNQMENAPPESLRRAAEYWERHGYRVRYGDAYLIQLIRRGWPGRESLPFLVLALLGLAGAVAALVIAISRRPWHVVTLAQGPGDRVLTHQQRALHPPEEE